MFVVLGASGRTGGEVARGLLATGARVRVVGRSAERLAPLAALGGEVRAGDADDPAFLTRAFAGADGAYAMVPTDPRSTDVLGDAERSSDAIASAARDAGLPRLVALSAIGAEVPSGTGFLVGLHRFEQRLQALDETQVHVLRAGSFFEVFLEALPVVRAEGVLADSVADDAVVPMVATRDVGAVAAAALRSDRTGVQELPGPEDLSWPQVAAILGRALGRDALPYVRLPAEAMVEALLASGTSPDFARHYIAMTRSFGDGTIRWDPTTDRSTTPTRFADFAAEVLAPAYAAA